MLYKSSKFLIIILLILSFSGCQKRYLNQQNNLSKSYKSGKQNIKIGDGEVKDSPRMHSATMRPYEVLGNTYYPTIATVGEKFEGIASWYGPDFHEKKTSNGETYDMYAMTAASKTLPMNTMVNVYNKDNGKSTIVRINDRGPFVEGRIIDLSNSAAKEIDMVGRGVANVEITVVGFHSKVAITQEEKKEEIVVGKFYLQVGAFINQAGAKITQDKYNNTILSVNYKAIIMETISNGKTFHRVWISGFRSEAEANDFRKTNGLDGAMIIAQTNE